MTWYLNNYPGSSKNKREVQDKLYELALGAPKIGHAVTLVGTDPDRVVNLMRDRLGWPQSRTWYVDWSPSVVTAVALDKIRKSCPLANVRNCDVVNVIEGLPIIGFADLDLMGTVHNTSILEAAFKTIPRLMPGGVMSITFFRGRDGFRGPRANEDRWRHIKEAVESRADRVGVPLEMVLAAEYQSSSPMSVAAWRRMR